MPVSHTPRGFAVYAEIATDYGHTITVQKSSAASEPKLWLFISDSTTVPGHDPHLTVPQATALRDALTEFIDTSQE